MADSIDGRDSEVLELTDESLLEADALVASEPAPVRRAPVAKAQPVAKAAPQAQSAPQATSADSAEEEAPAFANIGEWFRHHLNESSAFATSVVVHMILLIILVLLNLPLIAKPEVSIVSTPSDKIDELAEIPELDIVEPIEPIEPNEIIEQPETNNIQEVVSLSQFNDAANSAASFTMSDMGLTSVPDMMTDSVDGFRRVGPRRARPGVAECPGAYVRRQRGQRGGRCQSAGLAHRASEPRRHLASRPYRRQVPGPLQESGRHS